MANFLKTGVAWLANQLISHAATEITYRRGANTVTLSATVGQTTFKSSDPASGQTLYVRSRDYLIKASDLLLGGLHTLPARGDEIEEIQGTESYIHTVLPFNDEPFYRWSDPHRTLLRVHTKHTQTESIQ